MLNPSASLAMSASIPGKQIKGHSPSSIYLSNTSFILFAIVPDNYFIYSIQKSKRSPFFKDFLVYFLLVYILLCLCFELLKADLCCNHNLLM